jgi:hypothetical protein
MQHNIPKFTNVKRQYNHLKKILTLTPHLPRVFRTRNVKRKRVKKSIFGDFKKRTNENFSKVLKVSLKNDLYIIFLAIFHFKMI